ncbi:MAG: hypothetical protein S4CHLAM2_16860 [Chlamydiales bacterium]|nr:hypothetical protein [Chlamydiales bacterium]
MKVYGASPLYNDLLVRWLINRYANTTGKKRALYEAELNELGVKARPDSSNRTVKANFSHRTKGGIIVRFYGTYDPFEEKYVMFLVQKYLESRDGGNQLYYEKQLNKLGVQVEEFN